VKDVSAATVFDVLNDPVYRDTWDHVMREGWELDSTSASPNSKICYYISMYWYDGFWNMQQFVMRTGPGA